MTRRIPWLLLAAAAALAPVPAAAQYFGQNKVQYSRFDFKVLETEHFDRGDHPRPRTGRGVLGGDREQTCRERGIGLAPGGARTGHASTLRTLAGIGRPSVSIPPAIQLYERQYA